MATLYAFANAVTYLTAWSMARRSVNVPLSSTLMEMCKAFASPTAVEMLLVPTVL